MTRASQWSVRSRIGTSRRSARGFSLLELLVVIGIALLLTGLLMPAMSQLKEGARRLVCASNMRQIGMAVFVYTNEFNDQLPPSSFMEGENQNNEPGELMLARRAGMTNDPLGWDGLGLLYSRGYCDAPNCYYCPSHHGDHFLDRYAEQWQPYWEQELPDNPEPREAIYTNYHYAGHIDWVKFKPLKLDNPDLVLLTDGLRTKEDFNHTVGMNVLLGDGSVNWRDDEGKVVYTQLPLSAEVASMSDAESADYSREVWRAIQPSRE